MSNLNLPIIDFSPWLDASASKSSKQQTANALVSACRTSGFVYISNHGIPRSQIASAFAWSQRLFDLPTETKMQAPHPPGPAVHRGYSWPGLEKVSQETEPDEKEDVASVQAKLRQVVDSKESYEIGSETNDDQPNVWLPEAALPGFREWMNSFYWTCNQVATEILRALGHGLQLPDPEFFVSCHSGENNQLRLLHYPSVPAAKLLSGEMARIPAHTDWGTVTMLFQDDCGGLEVQRQDGSFVSADPVEGALVLNVGDLLMRWTNDQLKSTMHRVTMPPLADRYFDGPGPGADHERWTRARYSIPYFVSADLKAVVECLPGCADEKENPVKYAPVVQDDYRRMRARYQYETPPVAA